MPSARPLHVFVAGRPTGLLTMANHVPNAGDERRVAKLVGVGARCSFIHNIAEVVDISQGSRSLLGRAKTESLTWNTSTNSCWGKICAS